MQLASTDPVDLPSRLAELESIFSKAKHFCRLLDGHVLSVESILQTLFEEEQPTNQMAFSFGADAFVNIPCESKAKDSRSSLESGGFSNQNLRGESAANQSQPHEIFTSFKNVAVQNGNAEQKENILVSEVKNNHLVFSKQYDTNNRALIDLIENGEKNTQSIRKLIDDQALFAQNEIALLRQKLEKKKKKAENAKKAVMSLESEKRDLILENTRLKQEQIELTKVQSFVLRAQNASFMSDSQCKSCSENLARANKFKFEKELLNKELMELASKTLLLERCFFNLRDEYSELHQRLMEPTVINESVRNSNVLSKEKSKLANEEGNHVIECEQRGDDHSNSISSIRFEDVSKKLSVHSNNTQNFLKALGPSSLFKKAMSSTGNLLSNFTNRPLPSDPSPVPASPLTLNNEKESEPSKSPVLLISSPHLSPLNNIQTIANGSYQPNSRNSFPALNEASEAKNDSPLKKEGSESSFSVVEYNSGQGMESPKGSERKIEGTSTAAQDSIPKDSWGIFEAVLEQADRQLGSLKVFEAGERRGARNDKGVFSFKEMS